MERHNGLEIASDCKKMQPKYTGIAPFNTSPTRVIMPSLTPASLFTLVAPIFRLPLFFISIDVKSLVRIRPKGIEPSR